MFLSRRTLLRQLALVSASIALAPSLHSCSSRPSRLFKNIVVSEDQDELLTVISETIIPKTSSPGASDLAVNEYCIKMIDDCLSVKDQEKWLKGLTQFTELTKKNNKGEFTAMDSADRIKFLTELDESNAEDDINFFFKTMKRFTLRGYTTAEYFLTNVQGYKMLPGKYKGCVSVTDPS